MECQNFVFQAWKSQDIVTVILSMDNLPCNVKTANLFSVAVDIINKALICVYHHVRLFSPVFHLSLQACQLAGIMFE